ncbi:MAG TPA: asparaginase [Xanthobacteraceae bacterium]
MTWSSTEPILVEVVRGAMVESRHCGSYAVVDAAGRVVLAQGDIEHPVYARSAIKPLQALPLIETGAAEHFGLGDREIALACASHNGTAPVVAAVEAWLNRVGLTADDLECGADQPIDAAAAQALVRAGQSPSALHHNCSGKHAGFLSAARHCGEPIRGYIDAQHPVQRRVEATLASMTGLDLDHAPHGTDGCGIPVIGIPLAAMACAMARMADPAGLASKRAAAARRILDAMAAEYQIVAGASRFTREVMRVAAAAVRLKPGAEGVACAALPQHRLGVALKVSDGAGRAADVAMGALLVMLGAINEPQAAAIEAVLRPAIKNVAGNVVGELRPVAAAF